MGYGPSRLEEYVGNEMVAEIIIRAEELASWHESKPALGMESFEKHCEQFMKDQLGTQPVVSDAVLRAERRHRRQPDVVSDAVLRANLIAACDIVQEVTWIKQAMLEKCRLFMAEVTRLNGKAKAILGVEVRGLSPELQDAFEMKRSFILERVDRETEQAAALCPK